MSTNSGGTLDIHLDTTITAYNVAVSNNSTILVDRATAGAGVIDTLGTLSIGAQTLFLSADHEFASNNTAYGLNFGAVTLGGNATFDVTNNGTGIGTLTLGAISGGYGITKNDNGVLTLSASNSYTGGTVISGGTLSVALTNGLGTGSVSLASNTKFQYTGSAGTITNGFSVGSGTGTIQNSGVSALTLSGTLVKNGTILDLQGGTGGLIITGTITGSSANSDLIVDGGTTTLASSNSYNGPTYIINGAILKANVANALPTSNGLSAVYLDTTTNGSANGTGSSTLSLGASQSIASLSGASTSVVALSNNSLTLSNTSGNSTFAGSITGTGGSVTLVGSGTQTLSGSNNYSGGTTINGGSLLLGNAYGLGSTSGALNVAAGTLNLSSYNATVGAVSFGNGTITNTTGTLTGSSFTATNTGAAAIYAKLAGTGAASFTQSGAGTTTLAASNSYTGTTTITNGGTLDLGAAGYLGGTTQVNVSGGTLLLGGNGKVSPINTSATVTLGTAANSPSTLSMGGIVANGATARTASQTFSSLTLTGNSTIDFASLSGTSSLTFSSITMNGKSLNVFDWNGTNLWGTTSTTGGVGQYTHLIDLAGSGDAGLNLANISFYSGNSTSSGFLGNGQFAGNEIVPVPEPSVLIAAALLLGWLLFSQRNLFKHFKRKSEFGASVDVMIRGNV